MEGFWRTLYHPDPPQEYYEVLYNDTTPNKQVYDYKKILPEQRNYFSSTVIDWGSVYCFEGTELQKWINLLDITAQNPLDPHDDNTTYCMKDSFYTDYNDSYEHMQVPDFCLQITDGSRNNYLDIYLNGLYVRSTGGYSRIIDSLDYTKEQLYVEMDNPDYNPDPASLGHNEPEKLFVPIFESLTPELKNKVYVSRLHEPGTAIKYEDYFPIQTYKQENIKFIDNYCYIKTKTETVPIKARELILELNGQDVLIWSSSSDSIIDTETANVFHAAAVNYGTRLKYVIDETGETCWFNVTNGDVLCVRGQRNIDKPVWWYKGTPESKPEYLTNKILTDFYVNSNTSDKFCKYTDIYVLREVLDLDGDESTDTTYHKPLDLIDINKEDIYIRKDGYVSVKQQNGFTDDNEPNIQTVYKLMSSDFSLFSSFIDIQKIDSMKNLYIRDTNLKVDILEKINEDPEFELIYFDYALEPGDPLHTCNQGIKKFMTRYKKDIYGNNHVLYQDSKQQSLILYWELYYNYNLPVIVDENTYDCRHCWQKEVYKDFNKAKFWIDLLDSDGDLSKNSVNKIGIRQKIENNQTATALSFGDTPSLLWVEAIPEKKQAGYTYILLSDTVKKLIQDSAQGRACKDVIDEWLNKYAQINNTLSFSAIPIYHLEPNTEVFLNNKDLNVYGAYEINRITFPLNYNGVMQLQVTKLIKNMV